MRRIVVAAACLLLLTLLVLAGAWLAGPRRFERERAFVEGELSAALGRPVRIGGSFDLQLLPRPGFQATSVSVENLPGRPSPLLAQIGELELRFHSWRLLLGDVEIAELRVRDAEFRLEADAEGRFRFESHVEDLLDEKAAGPAPLRVRRVVGENLRLFVRAGEAGGVEDVALEAVSFEAPSPTAPVRLAASGTTRGEPFRFSATGGGWSGLRDASRAYPVSLEGRVGELDLRVEGEAQRPLELEGVALDFEAAADDAAALLPVRGGWPEPLGRLVARGRLERRDGVVSLQGLSVSAGQEGAARLHVSGSVGSLQSLERVELRLRLSVARPSLLQPLLDHPLPREGALDLSVHVSDAGGSLRGDLELALEAEEEGITLDLAGGDDDLRDAVDPRLSGALRAASLSLLARALGFEAPLPELAPVEARARLSLHDRRLSVAELRVEAGRPDATWAKVRGAVGDLLGGTDVELDAEFGAADLQPLRLYLDADPPDVGPVRGKARLSDRDGTLGVESFSVRGGREGVFRVDVAGSFDDVRETDEIELRMDVEARDLGVLGALLGADLPTVGPLAFSGRAAGSNERLSADGALRLGESTFHSQALASLPEGARPRVIAAFVSDHARLEDLGLAPQHAPLERGERLGEEVRAQRWWAGEEPLPFHRLRAVDAEVLVQAQQLSGRRDLSLRSVMVRGHLEDGDLHVDLSLDTALGGSLRTSLRADASLPEPRVSLRGDARRLDANRLASQLLEKAESAGRFDLSLDVESRGAHREALRSALSGRASARVIDGTLATSTARRFVFDLQRTALPSLRWRRAEKLGCFRTEWAIDEGVARVESLVLSGAEVEVVGTGFVDLGGWRWGLRLAPYPRNPGLLSVAAAVRVSGPLDEPVFSAEPLSMATSAARAVVSNVLRVPGLVTPSRRDPGAEREAACRVPLAPVLLAPASPEADAPLPVEADAPPPLGEADAPAPVEADVAPPPGGADAPAPPPVEADAPPPAG